MDVNDDRFCRDKHRCVSHCINDRPRYTLPAKLHTNDTSQIHPIDELCPSIFLADQAPDSFNIRSITMIKLSMRPFVSPTVEDLHQNLNRVGHWIAPLTLRLFLAWEFFESGLEKFNGHNWFADIQQRFPFPFNQIPATLNWELSMWAELICAVAILLGLGTRISAFILIVVTLVATAAVHWPADWSTLGELAQGYAISNKGFGNYKLPLIYLVAFMPLLLSGPGKLSFDALLARIFWQRHQH